MKNYLALRWPLVFGTTIMMNATKLIMLFAMVVWGSGISFIDAAFAAGGSSSTGGYDSAQIAWSEAGIDSLTKFQDLLKNPDYRMYVVNDSSYINILGLINNTQNSFVQESDISLDSVIVRDGLTMVSGYRLTDASDVYFVSQSQFKAAGSDAYRELLKALENREDSELLFLRP